MKKTGQKSGWTVPLNRIWKSHLTRWGMIPQGDWLCAVSYPKEIHKNWYTVTLQKLNQNQKYFNPLVSGPGWFEWWKNLRSKISLDCPFKFGNVKHFKLISLRIFEYNCPHMSFVNLCKFYINNNSTASTV